ncbi:MAG TPA: M67 family metallopeptidase [Candidatus Dormibacteraeota bacterium]|nr:M67 family metallopeptidase [Candidatus Dormibacteraeota bacterium]
MKIRQQALDAIRAHGAEGYPHEICGIMVGPRGERTVTEVKRARNVIVERARDRYEIDPRDQIRIEREADAAGLDIVGYYHSHPDHPAQASRFDTERAWAGYVYLIVAVHEGKPVDANAFIADNDGGPFQAEPLEVL